MKNSKIVITALIVSLFATSCLVDDEAVEFADGPYIVGFKNDVAAESYFADQGPVTKTYPVDILGGADGTATEEDIVINYEIDPSSTATEGQEFNFVDNSGSLTIPAGSSFTEFPLQINTGGFDPNEPTELILNLTSTTSDGAVVSSIDDQLAITFVGCQSNVDDFTYEVTTIRESDQAQLKKGIETLTMPEVNNFVTQSTGGYGLDAVGGSLVPPANRDGFLFNDICGDITIPEQSLGDLYSNLVYGSGEVDPETGDISLRYAIEFDGEPSWYVSTFVKQ